MKKIFLSILPAILLLAACTKNIDRFNTPTKQPTIVPAGPVFTYATKQLTDMLTDCSNNNSFRHIVEHWSQTIIQDATVYNFNATRMNDLWWNRMYIVLSNLKACDSILTTPTLTAPAIIKNERAITNIMAVYVC